MKQDSLYTGYPNIGEQEEFTNYIEDIFKRRWLTNNGKYVKQLEKELCEYLGVKHAIPVCNGTVGLEIAAKALGFNCEVILPSFTFVATAHMLKWQGIEPVFADINPETYTIDCGYAESLINSKTSGIIGVHLWGIPCDIEQLQYITQKHRIKLLFDAAHAFGCSYGGMKIGNFGDCEVFSFHATKVFNTFEGGAIVTNNDQLAERIRLMINFGFNGEDNVINLGINGKMSEICAAMGITNLKTIARNISDNKERYELYKHLLSGVRGITIVDFESEQTKSNYHYMPVIVGDDYGNSRDRLKSRLLENNVLARRYFYPGCHKSEPYKEIYSDLPLHVTNRLSESVLILPNGQNVSSKDIEKICNIIKGGNV